MTDVERRLMDLLTEQRAQVVREIITVLEEWASKRGVVAKAPVVIMPSPRDRRARGADRLSTDDEVQIEQKVLYILSQGDGATKTIAGFAQLPNGQVSAAITRLKKAGKVGRVSGHGMGTVYAAITEKVPLNPADEDNSTDGYPMEPEGQEL